MARVDKETDQESTSGAASRTKWRGGSERRQGSSGRATEVRRDDFYPWPISSSLTYTDNESKRVRSPLVPRKNCTISTSFSPFFITKCPISPSAEARSSILSQILLPEAADRLGRIRLVKESRAIDVENRLIMLAKSGQLRSKVTEDQLKELLGAVAENTQREGGAAGKIVISRRKGGWDDDDDLLEF